MLDKRPFPITSLEYKSIWNIKDTKKAIKEELTYSPVVPPATILMQVPGPLPTWQEPPIF